MLLCRCSRLFRRAACWAVACGVMGNNVSEAREASPCFNRPAWAGNAFTTYGVDAESRLQNTEGIKILLVNKYYQSFHSASSFQSTSIWPSTSMMSPSVLATESGVASVRRALSPASLFQYLGIKLEGCEELRCLVKPVQQCRQFAEPESGFGVRHSRRLRIFTRRFGHLERFDGENFQSTGPGGRSQASGEAALNRGHTFRGVARPRVIAGGAALDGHSPAGGTEWGVSAIGAGPAVFGLIGATPSAAAVARDKALAAAWRGASGRASIRCAKPITGHWRDAALRDRHDRTLEEAVVHAASAARVSIVGACGEQRRRVVRSDSVQSAGLAVGRRVAGDGWTRSSLRCGYVA
ncbi:hypothetical protein GGX14DRAFT_546713 [Mycena pura]|uniref:Uncharacterized protein n=1 Tax=Mycena pura TaxID=153505 RepID=A0AAD6UQ86_9AGAR|nr:hypothetical protein GGX14DRAFT_546713 [Mycena pura]